MPSKEMQLKVLSSRCHTLKRDRGKPNTDRQYNQHAGDPGLSPKRRKQTNKKLKHKAGSEPNIYQG